MELYEGQVVHIVTKRVNVTPGWTPAMDRYLGMEARITRIDDNQWVQIDIDGESFWWIDKMFQEYYDNGPVMDDEEVASIVESLLGEFKRV